VIRPAEVEAILALSEELERERARVARQWELRLERARYEAGRARRQFDRVEPENRLVARELERRWNDALRAVADLETTYRQEQARGLAPLTDEEKTLLRGLVGDVPTLWDAASTGPGARATPALPGPRGRAAAGRRPARRRRDQHRADRSARRGVDRADGAAAGRGRPRPHTRAGPGADPGAGADAPRRPRRRDPQRRRAADAGWPALEPRPREVDPSVARHPDRLPGGAARGDGRLPVTGVARALGANVAAVHEWLRWGFLTAERMAPTDPLWVRLTDEDVARLDGTRAAEGHGRWRLPEAQRRLRLSREEIRQEMRAGRFVGYREWTGGALGAADQPRRRSHRTGGVLDW
jgi:hypothetical protein